MLWHKDPREIFVLQEKDKKYDCPLSFCHDMPLASFEPTTWIILWAQNQNNHIIGRHRTELEQVFNNFIPSEFAQPGIRHFNAPLGSWAKEIAQEIVSNLAEIRRTYNWRIILELKISDPISWCQVSAKLQTQKTVTMLTLKSHVSYWWNESLLFEHYCFLYIFIFWPIEELDHDIIS